MRRLFLPVSMMLLSSLPFAGTLRQGTGGQSVPDFGTITCGKAKKDGDNTITISFKTPSGVNKQLTVSTGKSGTRNKADDIKAGTSASDKAKKIVDAINDEVGKTHSDSSLDGCVVAEQSSAAPQLIIIAGKGGNSKVSIRMSDGTDQQDIIKISGSSSVAAGFLELEGTVFGDDGDGDPLTFACVRAGIDDDVVSVPTVDSGGTPLSISMILRSLASSLSARGLNAEFMEGATGPQLRIELPREAGFTSQNTDVGLTAIKTVRYIDP